jgi:hypothetical protein
MHTLPSAQGTFFPYCAGVPAELEQMVDPLEWGLFSCLAGYHTPQTRRAVDTRRQLGIIVVVSAIDNHLDSLSRQLAWRFMRIFRPCINSS